MGCITDTMSRHHRECDSAFQRAAAAVEGADWPAAGREAEWFLREMARHIEIEEEVLFPAFEEATGMSRGPTGVMRMEHGRLRELFASLRAAVETQDASRYRDASAAVRALLQQHNIKEEGILYPLLDRSLGARAQDLLEGFETLST